MLLEGHQLGHYRLVRQIGSGGMGTIFLAEDTHMPRQVAVKVVRTGDDMPHTQEAAQRTLRSFQREMRAIVQLDHPHILPVFDFGQETVSEATYTYLVMLYRPEGSLSDWLRQLPNERQLSLADATELFSQTAQALHHAHTRGIVHQDVKPSNFLVRANSAHPQALPELLLADFGIARFSSSTTTQSQSHNVRGTPMFMAPEQWDGKPVPASDQYALAIMAYRLLTGRFPFQGTMGQIMRSHYMAQPPSPSSLNPQLNAAIDGVILRALAKEPGQRFSDILAFASSLAQAVRASESLQYILITANTSNDPASLSLSKKLRTASLPSESSQLVATLAPQNAAPVSQPTPQPQTPTAPLDEPAPTSLPRPAGTENQEPAASAHYFLANDDTTYITPSRPGSLHSDPTPIAPTQFASSLPNDDPTFIKSAERPMVPSTLPLATAPLAPATQAMPPISLNQPQAQASVLSQRYSPGLKILALSLLALIVLSGSGILLYKGILAKNDNASRQNGAPFSFATQTIHTPTGNITVTIITTATSTTGHSSTPVGGSTPGSGSTPTATSPANSSPTPQATATTIPPTATAIPPTPTPTPKPGCTISGWTLNLQSQSNGSSVFTVTPYCNRTVWLRLTQAPAHTTSLQVCFGSSDCSGWNSAPSTNIGTFIEFFSQISIGAGFTINARCAANCGSIYTVYGEAKY